MRLARLPQASNAEAPRAAGMQGSMPAPDSACTLAPPPTLSCSGAPCLRPAAARRRPISTFYDCRMIPFLACGTKPNGVTNFIVKYRRQCDPDMLGEGVCGTGACHDAGAGASASTAAAAPACRAPKQRTSDDPRPRPFLRVDRARACVYVPRPAHIPPPVRGPRVGAMTGYTPAEAGMRRMIVIRNRMHALYGLFEKKIAPSVALQYGVQELVQFADAYDGLMGRLTPEQKERVLCVGGLISAVAEHRDGLRALRNRWLAHPQDDDLFAEGASGFVRRNGLPVDPAMYYEMLACAVIFADTVRALLPDIAKPAAEKFNRTGDARPEYYCDTLSRIACSVRGRVEAARKRARKKCPGMDWDSLLGAAGVRLDQLGPGGPKAGIARGEGWREGGADRQ